MRIFKKNGLYCVNVDSDDDANRLISENWIEMLQVEIDAIFGDSTNLVGPSNTSVDSEGNVTFTPPPVDTDFIAAMVRRSRDCRMLCALDATGKYTTQQALIASGGTVASPITEQEYISVLQYIEDLRNIPQQAGFPWTGPTDPACPWPTKPGCVCDMPIIG